MHRTPKLGRRVTRNLARTLAAAGGLDSDLDMNDQDDFHDPVGTRLFNHNKF